MLVATLLPGKQIPWSSLEGPFDHNFIAYLEEESKSKLMEGRLVAVFGGLMKVTAKGNSTVRNTSFGVPKHLLASATTMIEPINRSVNDFLLEDDVGIKITAASDLSDSEAATKLLQGSAAWLLLGHEDRHAGALFRYTETLVRRLGDAARRGYLDQSMWAVVDAYFRCLASRSRPVRGLLWGSVLGLLENPSRPCHAPHLDWYEELCLLFKSEISGLCDHVQRDLKAMEPGKQSTGAMLAIANFTARVVAGHESNPKHASGLVLWKPALRTP
jgi:hypothetical protein